MGIKLKLPNNVEYSVNEEMFNNNVKKSEFLRYLRGVYKNKNRFINNYIETINRDMYSKDLLDYLVDNYNKTKPFSYLEAFKITDPQFRSLVFGSIDIVEMINSLGSKRIKTDGIPVRRKIYSESGESLGYKEYDNVYEIHEINGKKLGIQTNVYVIKCWCTSTNKEHWIWIEEEYKDDPLSAIASTFRFHENVIPNIKELKRQGDVMLIELNNEVFPSGKIIPLTKDQYFSLLTSES